MLWADGRIFAAGNRTIIKPSEYTPHCALLTKELCEKYFDVEDVAVVLGGPETGANFSKMPFDHLSSPARRPLPRVMRAAAENLVPVTLELGGKSPVIVSETADMKNGGTGDDGQNAERRSDLSGPRLCHGAGRQGLIPRAKVRLSKPCSRH